MRQCKYLNDIIDQDYRFVKKRIKIGLEFKDFEFAKRVLTGIEIVRMIKKSNWFTVGNQYLNRLSIDGIILNYSGNFRWKYNRRDKTIFYWIIVSLEPKQ